jgi:hypothetical protein
MTDMKQKTTLYLEGYYVSEIGYDYSLSIENLTEEQVNLIKEKQEDMSIHSFLEWLKYEFGKDDPYNYEYDEDADQEFDRTYDQEPELSFHESIWAYGEPTLTYKTD